MLYKYVSKICFSDEMQKHVLFLILLWIGEMQLLIYTKELIVELPEYRLE